MNDRKKAVHVGTVVLETVKDHLWLSFTILAVVAGAVGAALVPPLVLGRIVDGLTAGEELTLRLPLWYLVFTALAGGLESARESALTVFGQKTTHALRSRLMEKEGRLPADELNRQEPGALVSRFVGDVDTVETLFTAGIISMAADACRILSILIVVWQCSRGLAYLLLALLPVLFLFTRFVQKRMLHNQLKNRKAVSRASGYVPETVRNLRTIRTLGKETYMETRYDGALGESYRAIEGTNFYDALYSPVILTVNAAVVGAVMLLSASGKPAVLTLFGMTAGTAAAYLSILSLLFTVGRFVSTPIMAKVDAGKLLGVYMTASAVLFFVAFLGLGPVSVIAMIVSYLFVSIGYPVVFSLTLTGFQGSAVKTGSSALVMSIVGAALIPLLMSAIADAAGINVALLVAVPGFLYVAWYGLFGCKIGLERK